MSEGGGGRRRRALSADERALWSRYVRTVRPLRKSPLTLEIETAGPAAVSQPLAGAAAKPPPPRPAASRTEPPPLAPLERRLKQRIARGVHEIDARIDLHGLTQAQAHYALLRFLHRAQEESAKVVLVITGKGTAQERGVLRRQVPLWLKLAEFRDYVVGFDHAHGSHGGEGALYVRIRRRRTPA